MKVYRTNYKLIVGLSCLSMHMHRQLDGESGYISIGDASVLKITVDTRLASFEHRMMQEEYSWIPFDPDPKTNREWFFPLKKLDKTEAA
jgi:hypothetical protein